MRSSAAIEIAIGIELAIPAAPAATRMNRISSDAYVDELIASELKIASAFVFGTRSVMSASVESGGPMRIRLTAATARPPPVVGALAAGFATSWSGPA